MCAVYALQGGHLATGKDLIKAPNAFDADRLLKTPSRGWFTPAQIKAMERTHLKSRSGHVWIWFDPGYGMNLVTGATAGSSPGNAAAKLIRMMREYHGLNCKTDQERKKHREWAANHCGHIRQHGYAWRRSRECCSAQHSGTFLLNLTFLVFHRGWPILRSSEVVGPPHTSPPPSTLVRAPVVRLSMSSRSFTSSHRTSEILERGDSSVLSARTSDICLSRSFVSLSNATLVPFA